MDQLGSILPKIISDHNLSDSAKAAGLIFRFRKIVKQLIPKIETTELEAIYNKGKIYVKTGNSSVSNELFIHKEQILAELNSKQELVKAIVVKVG
jgi:hypothetical protein